VKTRKTAVRAFWFAILLVSSAPVAAQQKGESYPTRPVRWVVPYAAGGLPDTMARVTSARMTDSLGQQIVIDNRGGAGGIVGTEIVARSAPDGYTMLVADVGQLAINPFLYARLPYNPDKDFAPVTAMGASVLFLVVNASVPARSFSELTALAKAKPGQLNYGSSGIGSIHHIAMEALKSALGLNIVHVPYKGAGEMVPALLGGQVALGYAALPAVEPHVKAGRVRILAVGALKRTARMPDVPTVAESGVPEYEFTPLIGLLAPAGTPPAIVARMSQEVARALKTPEVSQRFAQLDIEPIGNTPQQYNAMIRNAVKKYGTAVKASGARIDN
jgi:tripartite-type tricarboxylate transporter receptor subunit TctC